MLLVSLLGAIATTSAQVVRGGEVLYSQVPNSLQVNVVVYLLADAEAIAADRNEIMIDWGDGTIGQLTRKSRKDISFKTFLDSYSTTHMYGNPNNYPVVVYGLHRSHAENITDTTPYAFYIPTNISFTDTFQNVFPDLEELTIPWACTGSQFLFPLKTTPVPKGDSLAYTLITPLKGENSPLPGYSIPKSSDSLVLEKGGVVFWVNPTKAGMYTFAARIDYYHRGAWAGNVIREMQLAVRDDCSEGIQDQSFDSPKIFPNPAVGAVMITGRNLSGASCELYDITGKVLRPDYTSLGNQMTIDISAFHPGLYVARVKMPGGKTFVKKFFVR